MLFIFNRNMPAVLISMKYLYPDIYPDFQNPTPATEEINLY